MIELIKFVSEEDAHQRLDVYVAQSAEFSRAQAQKLINQGYVLCNDEALNNSYLVQVDDEVIIQIPQVKDKELEPVEMDLEIIYEDDDVLVINKPIGLVVHPAESYGQPTLVEGLLAYSDDFKRMQDSKRPGIVQRLDKETGGLMVVAKHEKAQAHLSQQIQNNEMERIYHALVHGQVFPDVFNIDAPIGRNPSHRQNMMVRAQNSKPALTLVNVLERFKAASLVQCSLKTGRTHQIRVHMQFIKHPIFFDPKYGRRKDKKSGQLLIAKRLKFMQPTTLEPLSFEIDYNHDFQVILDNLRKEIL